MASKRAIAIVIAMTLMALILAGCLGSESNVSSQDIDDKRTQDPTQAPRIQAFAPAQCSKPWPSKIDMIQIPDSMVAGQTYIFKCQMFVQNYDAYCRLSPWYYAINTPLRWTFINSDGTALEKDSITSLTDGIATVDFNCSVAGMWAVAVHWSGNSNYRETDGYASVSATSANWLTNLTFDGFWPMESEGRNISLSADGGQMIGRPVAGFNYNESKKTTVINAGQAYFFWVNAETQQAYVDSLRSNGFNHSNVWGRIGPDSSIPLAEWHIVVSSGVHTDDVVVNAGWGWPSQSNAMSWKRFVLDTSLESVPSRYSMSVGHWATGQWTDADVSVASFPALTPGAIQFQKPGTYTLNFYLINSVTGEVKSPTLTATVTVSNSSEPSSGCPKPWPSTVEIINKPDNMIPGGTYTFTAQMMVQNFDSLCNPTPWYYPTNAPISWTFSNDQGRAISYQCSTGSDGTCSVSFLCPSSGSWTVTADWAGNEAYKAGRESVTVAAS